MATDFFERQDSARRQTFRLLIMFLLSVAVLIVAIYIIAMFLMNSYGNVHHHEYAEYPSEYTANVHPFHIWNPTLFFGVALGTLTIITVGSLYKIYELASGGEAVALMMGGRRVNPLTVDLAEKRLLNVVEEMALASGVPVPPVYVLDNEPSINAFAAGHQPGDAVVAVSKGSLNYLNREELQGVLGHEFSHILNGDMKLNLRLIGVINGILVLSIIGYYIMRTTPSSSDDNKGSAAIFVIGLALFVLGYLGVFLGNLIKSAISRQREFLADASSVQFTRNPGGLAGALKKIAALSEGSRIKDPHAAEISHMFFSNASQSFFNLLATHPPLEERIRILEPDFNGELPKISPLPDADEATSRIRTAAASSAFAPVRGPGTSDEYGLKPCEAAPWSDARRIGLPEQKHLEQAGQVVSGIPQALLDAAREPFSARGVIFVLLLSRTDQEIRKRQTQLLQTNADQPLWQAMQRLGPASAGIRPESRLPLLNLTIPALKQLSPPQYAAFRKVVEALIQADGTVDLFEYCLRIVLFSYLDVSFGLKKAPAIRFKTVDAVAESIGVVLAVLAYAGHDRKEDIEAAFQKGAGSILGDKAALPPQNKCNLKIFDAALAALAQASPMVKQSLMSAAIACITADGKTTLEESELLAAMGAALACPMPIGGQATA